MTIGSGNELTLLIQLLLLLNGTVFLVHNMPLVYPTRLNLMKGSSLFVFILGASMKAFEILGKQKGYKLVGSNNFGNNIFFVKEEKNWSFDTKDNGRSLCLVPI